MRLPEEVDDQLYGFEMHTDGSSFEVWCTGCGVTVVEYWSIPADLRLMVHDAVAHTCGT